MLPLPKKKERASIRKMNTAIFMLRCKELGLSVDDLENIEYGLVQDMMIEKSNDRHDYPYKAEQKDYDNF